MAVQTYKELAEIYAARISKCKDGDMRVIELNKIWMEIQTLTVDETLLLSINGFVCSKS
jgi:hypothetical protein